MEAFVHKADSFKGKEKYSAVLANPKFVEFEEGE